MNRADHRARRALIAERAQVLASRYGWPLRRPPVEEVPAKEWATILAEHGASRPVRPEPVRSYLTIVRERPAAMTRKRQPDPHEAGCAPTVRGPDPAEIADEEERRKGPVGRPKIEPYPVDRVVEFKAASLGTWRLGQVAKDDGGRTVEIKGRGPIARRRVRLPKKGVLAKPEIEVHAQGFDGRPTVFMRSAQSTLIGRKSRPKPRGRIRDGDYLRFVRQHPCLSCGARAGVQAHHHGGSRGVSQKADDYRTVPLCAACHSAWHTVGRLPGNSCLTKTEAEWLLYKTQVDLLIEWMGEAGDLLVEALESAGDPL